MITVNRKKLDLRDKTKVMKYFKKIKIDYMIMAAAKAGGIIANSKIKRFLFRKYRNTEFTAKFSYKKKNQKNNLFRYIMYLPKIF